MVQFEVYTDSIHGSDVLTFDTFDEARVAAEKWSKECDCPILIEKIERSIIYTTVKL